MVFDQPDNEVAASSADQAEARRQVLRACRGVIPGSLVGQVAVQLLAGWLVIRVAPDVTGMRLVLYIAFASVCVLTPFVLTIAHIGIGKSVHQLAQSLARERLMEVQASRRAFETQLGNALEMADDEDKVLGTVGRALRTVAGDTRVEILLADNSQAHLERALVSGADPRGPGCQVASPDACVAARRGQTQVFTDSEALDACPHLQDREYGSCRAVCVPVSIMGRTVGVVHLVEPERSKSNHEPVSQLEVLATQFGARLGMLRGVKESQIQASTDDLTGLLNRRAFENQVRRLRLGGQSYSIVMADLDRFKALNDTHGHEAGDRALRMFVNVLQGALRPDDLACRYGGEEFVLALPNCSAPRAVAICERVCESLVLASQTGTSPVFTASFGVAAWDDQATLEELIANADAALYQAKRSGRNRAVLYRPTTEPSVHTPAGTAEPIVIAGAD